MRFKIELKYFYGWDDAGWTEEFGEEIKPLRFETVSSAQQALDEFFVEVKVAAETGNFDMKENPSDYRIVAVNE